MPDDYLDVDQFALEIGVAPSTIYRWLKAVPSADKRRVAGRVQYAYGTLMEAMRRSRFVGVRDIQSKLGVSLGDLKSAGFPGYAVDRRGLVYSLLSNRKLTSRTRADGYVVVDVGDYGTQYVHRLVVAGWTKLPYRNTTQVDHKDGRKSNNRIENLEWVSPLENTKRRDKRLFPHPNTPGKYTALELDILRGAFAIGLTYGAFRKAHPQVQISATHYRRLKSQAPTTGRFPLWSDVPPAKWTQLGMAMLISQNSYAQAESDARVYASEYGDPNGELRPEEYAAMFHWLRSFEIADYVNELGLARVNDLAEAGDFEQAREMESWPDQVIYFREMLHHLVSLPYRWNDEYGDWQLIANGPLSAPPKKYAAVPRIRQGAAPWMPKAALPLHVTSDRQTPSSLLIAGSHSQ